MATFIERSTLKKEMPVRKFKNQNKLVLSEHMNILPSTNDNGLLAAEFIGAGDFADAFYQRQQYEVDAGRLEEPILYTPLYSIVEDASLPEVIPVNRLGPAEAVFTQIAEGGEVKFITVGESNFSVPIYQWGLGVKYTKKLVMFNQLWQLSEIERELGVSANARLNHIHLNPFLAYAYGAGNQTDGGALTFDSNASLPEKYLRTIEAAITAAVTDTTNPRRGPYVLLIAPGEQFTIERALNTVPQQGFSLQSSAAGRIQSVISYDGWVGSMGGLSTTFSGVTTGKAYLIDVSMKRRNFRSYVKQPLQRTQGNPDVSRFILDQSVYDIWLGTYADIAAATEEITWPS